MSVKPILFNTDMVRAIQDNRKTVTRRVIKKYVPQDAKFGYTGFTPEGCISARGTYADGWGEKFYRLPYVPGDILWVREAWMTKYEWVPDTLEAPEEDEYIYKADWPEWESTPLKWHPSIHMPKKAARIFLRVTKVWAERLQDITEEQAKAEGAKFNVFMRCDVDGWQMNSDKIKFDLTKPAFYSGFQMKNGIEEKFFDTARDALSDYWGYTVKPADMQIYGGDANPLVLVNEFERCEKPKGWCT